MELFFAGFLAGVAVSYVGTIALAKFLRRVW